MAVVSSHTLNGVDGTHAGGIAVSLRNLNTGETLFDTAMDDGGRLVQETRSSSIQSGSLSSSLTTFPNLYLSILFSDIGYT